MDNLLKVKLKSDLYGLQIVSVDQLVYCTESNSIYHLKDISRKNKSDGWELVTAIPKIVAINGIIPTGYLTKTLADLEYVKYQSLLSSPEQTIYGDISIIGNVKASGAIIAYATSAPINWWDGMPKAIKWTSGLYPKLGGIIVGANLTIDSNGVLNASGGAGAALWGEIGGNLEDQADINIALGLKSNTTHSHTATDIGLGNVNNESKITMFSSPIFTNSFGFSSSKWRFVENANHMELQFNGNLKVNFDDDGTITVYGSIKANNSIAAYS
jgi:hypothetical protein